METVRIEEATAGPLSATIRLAGRAHQARIVALHDASREELDWYFERWLHFPLVDRIRARDAGQRLIEYGETLFDSLFEGDVRDKFERRVGPALPDRVVFEIVGSPRFQALPWEALKDRNRPRPFSVDTVLIRRRPVVTTIIPASRPEGGPFRLLVVTARPGEAADVGYRTISRPLVEALIPARSVDIDLCRPGTWQALGERLREHPPGYYHALHFDLHGSLQPFSFARLFRDPSRGHLPPYEGVRPYLSFEQISSDRPDLVAADEVAGLLSQHRIPLVVLNACQSAKQVGADDTILVGSFLDAGLQTAVAMAWSVTVSAAERLVPAFYGALAAGHSVPSAVQIARRVLWEDKGRQAAFNEVIELEDWALPVVYQSGDGGGIVAMGQGRAGLESQAPPSGTAGRAAQVPFLGRDLDIQRIEKAVATRGNILLLRGQAGVGKTALLRHLSEWWVQTGFVEASVWFGFEAGEAAGGLWLSMLWQRLSPPEKASVLAEDRTDLVDAIAGELSRRRHLLVLEALDGLLPNADGSELSRLLKALEATTTIVVLSSRADLGHLLPAANAGSVYVLRGLDPLAAFDLADLVLRRHDVPLERREEPEFQDLLTDLAYFPSLIEALLPALADRPVVDLMRDLGQGNPVPDVQALAGLVAREVQQLSAEDRDRLACFANFTSIIEGSLLDAFERTLRMQGGLEHLDLSALRETLRKATTLGLLAPHVVARDAWQPHPVLGWYLRRRFEAEGIPWRRAVDRAFVAFYETAANLFTVAQHSEDEQERNAAKHLLKLHSPNLRRVMEIQFAAGQLSASMRPYAAQYDIRSLDPAFKAFAERMLGLVEGTPAAELEATMATQTLSLATMLLAHALQTGGRDEIMPLYERVYALTESLEERMPHVAVVTRAGVLMLLGLFFQRQRMFDLAAASFSGARGIWVERGNLQGEAGAVHQLGRVELVREHDDEATRLLQEAKELYDRGEGKLGAAEVQLDLATLAERQGDLAGAQAAILEAEIGFRAVGATQWLAQTIIRGAQLASRRSELPLAEALLKRALEAALVSGNPADIVHCHHELGILVQSQNRHEEALVHFSAALRAYPQASNLKLGVASSLGGSVSALELGRYELAEEALAIALQGGKQLRDRGLLAAGIQIAARLAQWNSDRALELLQSALEVDAEQGARLLAEGRRLQSAASDGG